MEWCLDASDVIYIVQSRPFQREAAEECDPDSEVCEAIENPVVLAGATPASGGKAVGRVFFPGRDTDGRDIPAGAVVVCRTLSPKLTSALGRLTAVISPVGSRAGHFASVAREYGVPVLVNAPDAPDKLHPGQIVSVDADAGLVYDGVAEPLRRLAGVITSYSIHYTKLYEGWSTTAWPSPCAAWRAGRASARPPACANGSNRCCRSSPNFP